MFVVVKNISALEEVISYCIRLTCIILLQYIKKHHPHFVEHQYVDLMLKSQKNVEFDVQKYRHEIPHGWKIIPRMKPMIVRNISQ